MWRLLHLIAIAALIGSAIYVYNIKYETILESEQIVKLRHQINKTNDEINVLRAEYAHLTRPDRIQGLADKLLKMQPVALNQIVRPEDIAEKSGQGDSIGRELQSLGLTSSPANGAAGASPAIPPAAR
jgi:cell division protein FtsL